MHNPIKQHIAALWAAGQSLAQIESALECTLEFPPGSSLATHSADLLAGRFAIVDHPGSPLTWSRCFAVPGADSIIDLVHPITGRSQIQNETLEQIRVRYPAAQLVRYTDHAAAWAARQDAPLQWQEISEAKYEEMLNVLPPAAWTGGAFLVGEAMDHHARTGAARFACYQRAHGHHFTASRPVTHAEFCALFGQCALTYS